MDKTTEHILRTRMHGLYLSRQCEDEDITRLSRDLMGLHCWFHRNVAFSALIRGAGIRGWRTALTKTWLYRGTLHGVDYNDLPALLALHANDGYDWLMEESKLSIIADRVIGLMEDGVYSRAEMRRIFAYDMDERIISQVLSPWGGVFVYLARQGRVAFRHMTSRDFDLIDAQPYQAPEEALPELLRRFFTAYGPATVADAIWFLGLRNDSKKALTQVDLSEFARLEHEGQAYYYVQAKEDIGDIPELTLLSGFDPLIVSYTRREAALPAEYKGRVILKSGICLPTIAVHGRVAGLWNIKRNEPVVEFFEPQPQRIQSAAKDWVEQIRWQTTGLI